MCPNVFKRKQNTNGRQDFLPDEVETFDAVAKSCSVSEVGGETLSIERRAPLSDKRDREIEAFESQRCILRKGEIFYMSRGIITILRDTLVPISKAMDSLAAKIAVDDDMENFKNASVLHGKGKT